MMMMMDIWLSTHLNPRLIPPKHSHNTWRKPKKSQTSPSPSHPGIVFLPIFLSALFFDLFQKVPLELHQKWLGGSSVKSTAFIRVQIHIVLAQELQSGSVLLYFMSEPRKAVFALLTWVMLILLMKNAQKPYFWWIGNTEQHWIRGH